MTLKWTLDLDDNDKAILVKGQNITENAEVTFEQDGREFDWWVSTEKRGPSQIWISTGSSGKGLSVNLQYDGAVGGYRGHSERVSLGCAEGLGLVRSGSIGRRLFSVNTRAGDGRVYNRTDVSVKLSVNVSLGECEKKEGKQIECSLNVVTNNP